MESVERAGPFRWTDSILRLLAEGGYAFARFAKPVAGGHTWQDWAHKLMITTGARQVQGPGACHLFGCSSASDLAHELDGACIMDVALVLEAKDEMCSVNKTQVDVFDGKTFDYFEALAQLHERFALRRMVWCTHAILPKVQVYAARKGIIMVGPDRVPLPALLAAIERWDAVEWLPDALLSEFVALAERACRPLTAQSSNNRWSCNVELWSAQQCEDLTYLHQLASDRWLDWLDRHDPLHYERYAAGRLRQIDAWSELRQCCS